MSFVALFCVVLVLRDAVFTSAGTLDLSNSRIAIQGKAKMTFDSPGRMWAGLANGKIISVDFSFPSLPPGSLVRVWIALNPTEKSCVSLNVACFFLFFFHLVSPQVSHPGERRSDCPEARHHERHTQVAELPQVIIQVQHVHVSWGRVHGRGQVGRLPRRGVQDPSPR